MKTIDLTPEYESLYLVCLKDWDKNTDPGNHKRIWYNKMKNKGLRAKLAVDDDGQVGEMIQYVSIEYSRVQGSDLYFVQCIWVHGYEAGIGNVQGQRMGKALLQAAEADARALEARGMVAWGMPVPDWMPAAWYEKHGYVKVDQMGYDVLVWKPFSDDAVAPRWIRRKKTPSVTPGQVTVTAFINGWCPAGCETFELARRATTEFENWVVFQEVDTSNRDAFLEWGIEDAVFVDDECITDGPPLSYDDIKARIRERLEALDNVSQTR